MAAIVDSESLLSGLSIDARMHGAIVGSVEKALAMCDMSAPCVGVASLPWREGGIVTGMIGVHGKVSGFITVNMAERLAVRAVNGLLQDEFTSLSSQVIDGVGEITNLIVGGIKGSLSSTPWAFSHITVPTVIVGKGYQIAYAKGLEFVCSIFEHQDAEAMLLDDRLLQVCISLMRL